MGLAPGFHGRTIPLGRFYSKSISPSPPPCAHQFMWIMIDHHPESFPPWGDVCLRNDVGCVCSYVCACAHMHVHTAQIHMSKGMGYDFHFAVNSTAFFVCLPGCSERGGGRGPGGWGWRGPPGCGHQGLRSRVLPAASCIWKRSFPRRAFS